MPDTAATAWAPLRITIFRTLWIAVLVSNVGTWMQTVGAQWLLVHDTHAALLVPLVQTATALPAVLFSPLAGVLADILDRRRLLLSVLLGMTAVGVALTMLTAADRMPASLLLTFTFALGAGAILIAPTYQSLVPSLVPRDQLRTAAALSSININLARAVGPALAGVVIARTGVTTVFALNTATEQRWLVVDVASMVELDQWEGVHQVCDPARAATYMRIGDTRYRWEFRLLEGETAADFESIEALQPLIGPWVEGIPCDQLELVRVAEYHFRAQLADRWRDRHVFLLGDAAHLTPPFIGQGLCAGVRDSMNLSWKIAGVISGDLPDSVLDRYEVERKPHARSMIRLAKLMGLSMTHGGRVGDVLRKLVAPRLHRIPGLRDRLLDSETPPLPRSAMVEGRGLRKCLAGRLCPNALLADGRRYDDATRGGFVFVSGVPLSPQEQAVLAGRGTEVLEVQPDSPLHTWLANGKAAAALVRPDFTVLRADRDVSALCDAAPKFLVA
jgi:hypothetical protein